ncbi:MAG TPA: flavin reductase family protein [Dehalococcoidia bacterium]|nr:flavin reductase family protein [Dehalococcoidia bacterium]
MSAGASESERTIFEGDDFTAREFRRAVWSQTATTVALITSAADGREDVMACEWAMMISASPLRFAIAVWPGHATHELIERSGEFGLSLCSDEQARLSHVSGSYSLHQVNKWELADFETYPACRIGAPMIAGCALNVECRVVATLPSDAAHTLFIGEALWARYDPEKRPLIYHGGKYWYLGPQVPKD